MRYLVAVFVFFMASPVMAQDEPERIPWFVIDAHAATVGLPQAEGWVPEVATTTELPGRNWGTSFGATVYPVRLGVMTIGVGALMMRGSGTADTLGPPPTTTGTSSSPPPRPVIATVSTSITHLVPHLSLNFGKKQGWSYLSAGMGRSKSSSVSHAIGTTNELVVPESSERTINFGGGARWFMKPHIGAGFDVRFIKLPSRSVAGGAPTMPSTAALPVPGTRLWSISAGISIQ